MKKRTVLPAVSVPMITFIFLLISFIFMPSVLVGQYQGKARLTGIVTDTEGKPVAGVTVKLFCFRANSGFDTKTDKAGIWKAMWVRGGKWNVDLEKSGYAPQKISVNLMEDSKVVTVETTLEVIKGPVLKKDLMKDFEKGSRLFDAGKHAAALKIFENIVAEFPDAHQIYLNIGNCHFAAQDYRKAIDAYLKVVEKEPGHSGAALSIGNCWSNLKEPQKALEWYQKVNVEKIDDHIVLYNIGTFYFNSGNIARSVEFFRRSTQVRTDFVDGWYQLGMTLMSTGDNKAAITAFETFLTLEGDSDRAKQAREIIQVLKQ